MDIKKRIGIQVRELRKAKGLTQDELADKIGRSTEALSNIERGISLPGIDTLERLSETLDVHMQDFFAHQKGKVSARRTELTAQLVATASKLTDKQLALAVAQVRAINEES